MPSTEFHLQVGDWATLGALAAQVRTQVFVQEQAIPADMEWDAADASALHAVICDLQGQAVATGRLLQPEPGIAKIGRMAVLRSVRKHGLGRQVLLALIEAARQRGDRSVVLSAQHSAIGFYTRLGFTAHGAEYDDVGIAHRDMSLTL